MTRARFPALAMVLLLAATMTGSGPVAAQSDRPVGQVRQVNGSATVLRSAGRTSLTIGQSVYREDRIFTGDVAGIRIDLNDGSVLTVGANTEVAIAEYAMNEQGSRLRGVLSLVLGILRATVVRPTAHERLEIRTRDAVAAARSTDWIVEAKEDGTSVFVVGGRVDVAAADDTGSVVLEASYGIDIPRGEMPKTVKRWGLVRVKEALARTRLR